MREIVSRSAYVALCGALLLLYMLTNVAGHGDGKKYPLDHEIAREALLRGEILPLEAVLAEVRKSVKGEFVGVELERRHGVWVYTLKMLTPAGELQKIRVEARTGKPWDRKQQKD